ncbi:MAG: hypothetical protein J6W49_03980 [Paludibacteraceae bacterium]|jgi:hypothetical protein|nr:hypothetical protein [Paludibacteraceae bacterium]
MIITILAYIFAWALIIGLVYWIVFFIYRLFKGNLRFRDDGNPYDDILGPF